MSEHHFHVHGHDQHELEHRAHGGNNLASRIAIMTAILSTIGAVFSYEGGATQTHAMLLKDEAMLRKSEATDQWGYFQAKSQKQAIAEMALQLLPAEKSDALKEKIARYEKERGEIKQKAEALDAESEHLDKESQEIMNPHHRLTQGMTLIQIAIAISSMAALTQRRWLVIAAGIAAIIGSVIGGGALLF